MALLALILVCAAAGGMASAAFAVVFLWLPPPRGAWLLPHLVSFATGALLGAALLGLLPEAMAAVGPQGGRGIGLALLAGLGFFFAVEKMVLAWHAESHDEAAQDLPSGHSHGHSQAHSHPPHRHASGVLVLVGDCVHNALDGLLIASAFLSSVSLGWLTTLAVAAHEIPHRVGDFALLVHAGFSHRRALVLNIATGLASVVGALAAYLGMQHALQLLPYALAFAAAGFLYIALSGLIPGLQRSTSVSVSLAQGVFIALGVATIALTARFA